MTLCQYPYFHQIDDVKRYHWVDIEMTVFLKYYLYFLLANSWNDIHIKWNWDREYTFDSSYSPNSPPEELKTLFNFHFNWSGLIKIIHLSSILTDLCGHLNYFSMEILFFHLVDFKKSITSDA